MIVDGSGRSGSAAGATAKIPAMVVVTIVIKNRTECRIHSFAVGRKSRRRGTAGRKASGASTNGGIVRADSAMASAFRYSKARVRMPVRTQPLALTDQIRVAFVL